MARINVEDDWFADPLERRAALVKAVKELPRNEDDQADGMAMRAWRMAQRFWKDGRKLIPEAVWERAGLEPLIVCDLAERQDDGVYVKGSASSHAWIYEKTEKASKAGKASADARRKKNGTAIPSHASNTPPNTAERHVRKKPNNRRTADRTPPNPLALLYSEETFAGAVAPAPTAAQLREPVGSDVWDAYRAVYFAKYRVLPVRNAKANANCQQLVKRLGGDGAVCVVKFYLTHSNQWYVQKLHALEYCVKDCEALHTQWMANHRVTSTDALAADKGQANATAFQSVHDKLKKELEANGTI